MRRLASYSAAALARALLCVYPPAFRREMGAGIVDDVRACAGKLAHRRSVAGAGIWLLRLGVSLIANAAGAWADALRPASRRTPERRRARPDQIWARSSATRPPADGGATFSWLDVKLGARMLRKYPGLTLAGGLGIAVAIAIGGGFFAFAYAHFYPTIPLSEGNRLVGLENWDLVRNNEERRSIHDFYIWRDEMQTVEDMTAFGNVTHNLIHDDGSVELIRVAEMSPSGFTLARVAPLMGRSLVSGDAEPGADPVIVIGHDVWRARFAADPDIVGRELRLGDSVHTVVGVMPDGFAFPMDHSYWTPLKARPADYPMRQGPRIFISGRLAQGHDLDAAQAELSAIGQRMAADHPQTHGQFRAQVMPYVYPLLDVNQDGGKGFFWEFSAMNASVSLILVIVCINVAVLVYARTAARRGEIAIRSALGASRGRIVAQMFIEALVLSTCAALLGVALTKVGLNQAESLMATELGAPFWMNFGLSVPAMSYIFALTLVAAVITGVVPGLQATGRNVQTSLNRFSSAHGPRLGKAWTALIIIQVAAVVTGLPVAAAMGWWEVREFTTAPTFPVDRFLGMAIEAHPAEFRAELGRQLDTTDADAYTFMLAFPRGPAGRIGFEGRTPVAAPSGGFAVRTSQVDDNFFATLEAEVLAGRPFRSSDWDEGAAEVAVVNRALVQRYLPGEDAVGRRLRYRTEDEGAVEEGTESWIEIVGVVEEVHRNPFDATLVEPRVYRPYPLRAAAAARLLIRVAGDDPSVLAGQVREIVARLDPTLRTRVFPLAEIYRQQTYALQLVALLLASSALAVLVLSAAGIYALMAFTVTQRQREIGIRAALGAPPGRLIGGVLGHAVTQVLIGVALGLIAAIGLDRAAGGELLHGQASPLLALMAAVMTAVGFFAVVGPARRGLRIDPTEALKGE